ncbi:GTP cyclohydrolase II [Oceanobacillus neutriphilus]|uniref:Multifunctional fusion protein n=1 Tax=Oceanobacillus neutriphilus TaxID=531815 RepID=A0ABQ2NW57_9BACI|nr:GTP cyclohydrolase II [Oceanobacillus neutriphilus]GGP11854.1 GTP cyclohydrolase-2 [Oceanobacillus neutriphilus]
MTVENIEAAVTALKHGRLIIIADDENREAEGDLVGLSSKATAETINFMTKHARGLICAPVSKQIARDLNLWEMTKENTDEYQTAFTISVDHKETTTGISAFERAKTVQELANTDSRAADFNRPGHIFPLIAKNGGVLERRGHTEAAVDLAKLAGDTEAAYICEILKEDGTMARFKDLKQIAAEWDMPLITIEELADYLAYSSIKANAKVKLPTKHGDFDLSLYQDKEGKDQLVLSMGQIRDSEEPILVRVHSECLTGDIFGSHRCDCGEQLERAMEMIAAEGQGAVLYLRQEGRGIGLLNKLKTYELQEQGSDTYEANVSLGFLPDERRYDIAAWLLKKEGISKIRLLTNNPDKVKELQQYGIEVAERISIETTVYNENKHYLKIKKDKFHHLLSMEGE